MTVLSLDYETRSKCDLLNAGLHAYARDPSTRVLMAAYAIDDGPVQLWEPHKSKKAPAELAEAMRDPSVVKFAWNAPFEEAITTHTLGAKVTGWRDTMVCALYASLPGSLALAGVALGLPEEQLKMPEGKRLIRKFSLPRTPTKDKPWEFNDWSTDEDDWALFCDYCKRDVEVERAIRLRLASLPVPEREWELWNLDREINGRGIPVDIQFVQEAIRIGAMEKARLVRELKRITGLVNPMTQANFLGWAHKAGYPYGDLRKATVDRAIREGKLRPELVDALTMRSQAAKTSMAKFDSIAEKTRDGRIYNTLQFYGASRTGRWGGRDPQPQNFARPMPEVEGREEYATDLVRDGEYDQLQMEFGKVIPAISSVTRSAFCAPEGKVLYAADLNAIENRVLGWLADCDAILDVFRKGLCPYLSFATFMYGQSYEELHHEFKVLKVKTKRTNAKPAVLGCFAAGTEVLTQRGWVRIIEVTTDDCVHDGQSWVRHGGVVFQGEKPVINLGGVQCTADHRILTETGWVEAGFMARDGSLLRSALALARGLLKASNVSFPNGESSITTPADAPAELTQSSPRQIWKSTKPSRAFLARIGASISNWAAWRKALVWTPDWLSASPTASTPSVRAVSAEPEKTATTASGGSSAASRPQPISSPTASRFKALKTQNLKWIVSTTKAITNLATFALQPASSSAATAGLSTASNTEASSTLRLSFTRVFARATGAQARSHGKRGPDCLPNKSLQTKNGVAAPTYDIVDAGPNSRFVIRTAHGPVIAHNCGYMLGGGDEVVNPKTGDVMKTGLYGYAEAMGIKMAREEAHRSVKIFREAYPEVVQFWYALRDAAFACVRDRCTIRVGKLVFNGSPNVMRVRLPNGRVLHYIRPRIEEREREFTRTLPDGKVVKEKKRVETLTYEGVDQLTKKWGRITTHPGKLTENFVQAVARDVLAEGLLRAKAKGFDIVLHVHDEIVCEVPENSPLKIEDLCEAMAAPISWADGLPLAAEGAVSKIYKK